MNKKIITLLKKIEEQNAKEIAWIVGPETGRMLHWLMRVWQPKNIVEIGTSIGYSAIWMAAALEANGRGELFTIESHKKRFELAQKNIAESGLGHRIFQFLDHAPEIFERDTPVLSQRPLFDVSAPVSLPEQLDFAFFDATKKDTQRFFDAVFPRLSTGGLVAVDNVRTHRFDSMLKFINAIHKDTRVEVVEIPVGAGLLLARKK